MSCELGSDGQWSCTPCKRLFATFEALMEHKRLKRESGAPGHIFCKHCGIDFKTQMAEIKHTLEFHPHEQQIVCPACQAGPFPRLFAFVAHIEQGQCPRLNTSMIDEMRNRKTAFSRSLQELTGQPMKSSFAKYINPSCADKSAKTESSIGSYSQKAATQLEPSDHFSAGGSRGRDKEECSLAESNSRHTPTQCAADPSAVDRLINEKPPTGYQTKLPGKSGWATDSSVSDWSIPKQPSTQSPSGGVIAPRASLAPINTNIANWAIKGELPRISQAEVYTSLQGLTLNASSGIDVDEAEVDAPNQEPNSQHLPKPGFQGRAHHVVRTQLEATIFSSMDPDHPDHPSFRAADYYSPYGERWRCPKVACNKAFKTARSLIGHLRGPAHDDTNYQCPYCLKNFKTLTAIVSHAEQSSVKCHMRDSENYDAFIHQLTGGIAEVDNEHHYKDGTVKYKLAKDWNKFW
ncbi:hypothetical protein HIM_00276 [Hirsutella minnesotensis 3608]|nr:hypothetical protein HIM_00276 [Hirsutella minnesotensis 3608]